MKKYITTTLLGAIICAIACIATGLLEETKAATTTSLIDDPGFYAQIEDGTVNAINENSGIYASDESSTATNGTTSLMVNSKTTTTGDIGTDAKEYGTVIDRSPTIAALFAGTSQVPMGS